MLQRTIWTKTKPLNTASITLTAAMVLEEAANPTETFSDSIPTSDIDPYASGNSNPPYTSTRDSSYIKVDRKGAEPVYININTIPKPLIIGPPPGQLSKAITQNCELAAQVLQRPVTQEEAEAFAYHLGRGLRIGSYGAPVGVALATVQAYRTSGDTFRFPGWTPMKEGSRFNPDKFGPLTGGQARRAWGVLRIGSYWTVGLILGQVFFGSYAISTSIAARFRDPRLKTFTEELRKRQQEGGNRRKEGQGEGEGARSGESFEMRRQRRNVQRQGETARSSGAIMDDASPTGGAFEQDLMQGQADTGLMDDGQVKQHDYNRRVEQVRAESEAASETLPAKATERQRRSSGSESGSSSAGAAGGSTWARIRQDAMGGGGQKGTTKSRDSSTGEDSFSFSQGDEDRQLAKSQAQKDFDAQVERERRGEEFSESGGGRRKW